MTQIQLYFKTKVVPRDPIGATGEGLPLAEWER